MVLTMSGDPLPRGIAASIDNAIRAKIEKYRRQGYAPPPEVTATHDAAAGRVHAHYASSGAVVMIDVTGIGMTSADGSSVPHAASGSGGAGGEEGRTMSKVDDFMAQAQAALSLSWAMAIEGQIGATLQRVSFATAKTGGWVKPEDLKPSYTAFGHGGGGGGAVAHASVGSGGSGGGGGGHVQQVPALGEASNFARAIVPAFKVGEMRVCTPGQEALAAKTSFAKSPLTTSPQEDHEAAALRARISTAIPGPDEQRRDLRDAIDATVYRMAPIWLTTRDAIRVAYPEFGIPGEDNPSADRVALALLRRKDTGPHVVALLARALFDEADEEQAMLRAELMHPWGTSLGCGECGIMCDPCERHVDDLTRVRDLRWERVGRPAQNKYTNRARQLVERMRDQEKP